MSNPRVLKSDKGFEVGIHPDGYKGWWTYPNGTEGGGLWFQVSATSTPGDAGRKLELVDYDGTFELPKDVIATLRGAGFIVNEDFE